MSPPHPDVASPAASDPGQRPRRVCLSSPRAYPLFDPRDRLSIGGAETHAWLLARGLSQACGVEVDFVVRAPLRFRRREFGAISVWNYGDGLDACRHDWATFRRGAAGGWRSLTPRLAWSAARLAVAKLIRRGRSLADGSELYCSLAADAYSCFGVSRASLTVARAARAIGRRSTLFLESDSDLDLRLHSRGGSVSPNGETAEDAAALLAEVDAIVAQSARQQSLLLERFGRTCTVLPNPFDLDEWQRRAAVRVPGLEQLRFPRYVLWVGRADQHHKRPALCLELARRLPAVHFLMVLNPWDPGVAAQIRGHAPRNVEIVERFPYADMPAVFSSARAFVSTGSREFEGAPHVFLQAAASGIPMASLEVDGEILDRVDAGVNAHGDFNRLTAAVAQMWNDDDACRQWGAAGRAHMKQHHALTDVARAALEVIAPSGPVAGGGRSSTDSTQER